MRIPYVIDNIEYRLGSVMDELLRSGEVDELDIATAYFSIRGYQQLRHTLPTIRKLRLLLGDEPTSADDLGTQPDSRAYLRHELNAAPLSLDTQILVEEPIRFLKREEVEAKLYLGHEPEAKGRKRFLHAKCYLFYGGRGGQNSLFDRFNPLVGIVGSSNFTGPGLTTNRELNLVHKTLLDEDEIADEQAHLEVTHHVSDLARDASPTLSGVDAQTRTA